jgi:hypothetical protein
MTISEELFDEFCVACGIACRRLPESTSPGVPSADFCVELGMHAIVVEVKQFDPNPEEQRAQAAILRGETVVGSPSLGDRIRKAIGSASRQLKSTAGADLPAMLVVYDNVHWPSSHTDPYSVATAMNGFDEVPVDVPSDPAIASTFGDVRSSRNGRKLTKRSNTTVSAIGVLSRRSEGPSILDIFHNRHAARPISPDWIRHPLVRHWRFPENAVSSLVEWDLV